MLIVGSVALNKYDNTRTTKDLDIICYKSQVPLLETLFNTRDRVDKNEFKTLLRDSSGRQIECMLADGLEGFQYMLEYHKDKNLCYANEWELQSVKLSHIYRPIRFKKHIEDLHNLQGLSGTLNSTVRENILYKMLLKDQEKIHGHLKTPNLNKSSKSFFNDNVIKIFNHDDIHEIVAHKEKPMYTYMQKEGSEVLCDKSLWDRFTHQDKINTVLEETYVIALERKLLPSIFLAKKHYTEQEAFDYAIMRICTTLCRGWFREFAVDNYMQIQKSFKPYLNKFLKAFEDNKIKKL